MTDFAPSGRLGTYGMLCENMTSSAEPEVHNLLRNRQRSTRATATDYAYRKFRAFGHAVLEICERTDRQRERESGEKEVMIDHVLSIEADASVHFRSFLSSPVFFLVFSVRWPFISTPMARTVIGRRRNAV